MAVKDISIEVAVRCRPFVLKDRLGVSLTQIDDDIGEVKLLHSKYQNAKFGFSYAWWSGYGYQSRLLPGGDSNEDEEIIKEMKLVSQEDVYNSCGSSIERFFLEGNSIVLFCYGLSGSGKTYTIFGIDDPQDKDSWYKHSTPQLSWGLFPRLAYKIFQNQDNSLIRVYVKYFQNIVDTVRDLLSKVPKEKNYKTGLKKDSDGYIDIDWCTSVTVKTWDELQNLIEKANNRKAISPTQFNPQSTRGHCILVFFIEVRSSASEGIKKKGRIYVCDLAGTEPAADVVYAKYSKRLDENSNVIWKYLGQHEDIKRSKDLQEQGKKINLSLSEMAQFFMKMAKTPKLNPGQTIPGCNTYFLCKYLKDTMLRSRTYLFCAVRPELTYQRYTYSTLQFAVNASTIKLLPTTAQTSQSNKEKQLIKEIEKSLSAIRTLKENSTHNKDIHEKFSRKIEELRLELDGCSRGFDDSSDHEEEEIEQMKARGIYLVSDLKDKNYLTSPYLLNVSTDKFRDKRYFYSLSGLVTIGKGFGDIRPLDLFVVDNHCWFQEKDGKCTLSIGGGIVFHNGVQMKEQEKVELEHNDRLMIGSELLVYKTCQAHDQEESMSSEEMLAEYIEGTKNLTNNAAQEANKQLIFEKQKLEQEILSLQQAGEQEEIIRKKKEEEQAWKSIDNTLFQGLAYIRRMKEYCSAIGREGFNFTISLQQPKSNLPTVKILISYETESRETYEVFLDVFDFQQKTEMFGEQLKSLKVASQHHSQLTLVPVEEDALLSMFDVNYEIGVATGFLLHCALNLDTEEEDEKLDVIKSILPYDTIGHLTVRWKALESMIIETPRELLGKKLTYRLQIDKFVGLKTVVKEAFVCFDFGGDSFLTELCYPNENNEIVFNHISEHTVDQVSEDFLEELDKDIKFYIHVKPAFTFHGGTLNSNNECFQRDEGLKYQQMYEDNRALRLTVEEQSLRIQELENFVKKQSKLVKELENARNFAKEINLSSSR